MESDKPTTVVVSGTVTDHESHNGFIHYEIDGPVQQQKRCAEDNIIIPHGFLHKGTPINITLKDGRAVKISPI